MCLAFPRLNPYVTLSCGAGDDCKNESIERQRLLTSGSAPASDRSMMDVSGLGFMGFAAEPETE